MDPLPLIRKVTLYRLENFSEALLSRVAYPAILHGLQGTCHFLSFLGGVQDFTGDIVARIFAINGGAFVGLLALHWLAVTVGFIPWLQRRIRVIRQRRVVQQPDFYPPLWPCSGFRPTGSEV